MDEFSKMSGFGSQSLFETVLWYDGYVLTRL